MIRRMETMPVPLLLWKDLRGKSANCQKMERGYHEDGNDVLTDRSLRPLAVPAS